MDAFQNQQRYWPNNLLKVKTQRDIFKEYYMIKSVITLNISTAVIWL